MEVQIPKIVDSSGGIPLHRAVEIGFNMKAGFSADGSPYMSVSPAADRQIDARGKLVSLLMKHGSDPNARTKTGSTPLMLTSYPAIALLSPAKWSRRQRDR